MTVAAAIRRMLDAGFTMDQALVAAEVFEVELRATVVADQQADRRRERDRERKRLRNSADSAEIAESPLALDKEAFPQTPIQEIKPKNPPIVPPSRQRFADPAIVLQAVLDPMTAKRWTDHLAQKRNPLTAVAAEEVVTELRAILAAGGNPVEAVTLSISKNWKTVSLEYCRSAGMKFAVPAAQPEMDWPVRLKAFAEDGTWAMGWGPRPGDPGCKAPAELISRTAA
jgi:hypothetical protein